MHFIADIILAAIIVINTVLGYKRGLVKTVFGLCAVVISVISTSVRTDLFSVLTNWMNFLMSTKEIIVNG